MSAVARVEVPAALWRKQRGGDLSAEAAALLVAAFEVDYLGPDGDPAFVAVGCGARVLERAAALTASLGLMTYDAVQLASGMSAREADPGCSEFACFDGRLRAAAARSGFALVPA